MTQKGSGVRDNGSGNGDRVASTTRDRGRTERISSSCPFCWVSVVIDSTLSKEMFEMTKAEKINMVIEDINWRINEAEKSKADAKRKMIKELHCLAEQLEVDERRNVVRSDFSYLMSLISEYENADIELKDNRHQKQMIEFITKED